MSIFGTVARHVDSQKADLINYLLGVEAVHPGRAVDLEGMAISKSVLKEMMNRKIVMKTSSGKYYVDPSKIHEAHGASDKFILYALGFMIAFIVALAVFVGA